MPEVSIVIVCMNRPDILFPCLDSIRVQNQVAYECWVVAYRFSPENLKELKEKYPWVQVVESNGLRGFAENNNLALKQAKGRYCFVVNDDTVQQVPVIDRLVADIEKLPENAAAVSPRILLADGRLQTCGRGPWSPWRYARHYLHQVDETRPSRWNRSAGLFQTFTLNGACFLIKTEAFKKVGWFDERYFFTPEDIALGHQLNAMGYTAWADADTPITHLAGGSVSAMEAAIKPARVRGSMLFYGEPFFLKTFIWCFELARVVKYVVLPRTPRRDIMRRTARNVMRTVFSHRSPKEIFSQYCNNL